ncbi:hypothetical protein BS47DRAFT_1344328, partial [Hydnum rufescens UP504]
MKFYDIFDPNGYNNTFVFAYAVEPILVAGCHIPTSPEKRSVTVKAFYGWLCGFLGVETDEKWSLYPCNIKPGPEPFSVAIESIAKVSIERDSTDHLSPGAYIILLDETKYAPRVSADRLNSEALLAFPRSIAAVPASVPGNSFCNITGVTLSDENKSVVPIIQNRIEEKRLIIFVGPCEQLPADLDTPQNYLTMASSLRPQFDQYAFGIDVDDDYRIIQFSKPSPEFDITKAGSLKIPESQAMPYDNCLRLHFQLCIHMYLASPPPGARTFTLRDVHCLQDELGLYEADEPPPELTDPVWDSPLGQEVLRSIRARG